MEELRQNHLLFVQWDAPQWIRACVTTRLGGVSKSPYQSLNLGLHVGDRPEDVMTNRQRLNRVLQLNSAPCWLEQVHSDQVVEAMDYAAPPRADASFTRQAGVVSVVMTADCLPVLFTNRRGTVVAAAHAGWRGLHGGILEQTVRSMGETPESLLCWLGPAIGPRAFEVGAEVREAFVAKDAKAERAFSAVQGEKYLADLELLARQTLANIGISQVFGGGYCTVEQEDTFFSYRRDHNTGRMASLIWINGDG